jgi:Tfp pilus assembly protein PilV
MSMRASRRIGAAGLTLIEFLIATSIMAFAALGVAGMFPAAFHSVIVGGQVTKATILAQEMVDMIRNESFDHLMTGYNGFDTRTLSVTCPLTGADLNDNKKKWKCDLFGEGVQTSGRGIPGGYGVVTVASVPAPPPDLLQVTVTVFWDRDSSRSVNLVTYVARSE